MKARVKATGDIVDATYWHTAGNGVKYYDIDKSGYTMMEDELDFDFSYTPDYWTRLEHQYAGIAMQGILSNQALLTIIAKQSDKYAIVLQQAVANDAYNYATALVEKLKKSESNEK